MNTIALPTTTEITPSPDKPNEAIISIRPCFPGYGTTIGNALRRVLLSSLPGGAVTAFKIKGVSHEFSSLENVKEDVVEISLNLKQLRLRVHTDEPVRLQLKAKGEKEVTAKDIIADSNVEIANTDLVIATLTSKTAEFEMELIVSQGIGYVPVESRDTEGLEVDMIALDAIFTPIKNVGFKIENVRVGQMTNWENLLLTVETDGTITPQAALEQSTKILIDHFNFIAQNPGGTPNPEPAEIVETIETAEESAPEEKEEKPKRKKSTKKAEKEAEEVKESTPDEKEE